MRMAIITRSRYYETNNNLKKEIFLKNYYINYYHHQAIKDLAPDFHVSAVSSDGYIEGIEKGNVIGVQWHPEIMKDLNFFKKFINKYIIKKI